MISTLRRLSVVGIIVWVGPARGEEDSESSQCLLSGSSEHIKGVSQVQYTRKLATAQAEIRAPCDCESVVALFEVTSRTSSSVDEPLPCEQFCQGHCAHCKCAALSNFSKQPWSERCKLLACSGCQQCGGAATRLPQPFAVSHLPREPPHPHIAVPHLPHKHWAGGGVRREEGDKDEEAKQEGEAYFAMPDLPATSNLHLAAHDVPFLSHPLAEVSVEGHDVPFVSHPLASSGRGEHDVPFVSHPLAAPLLTDVLKQPDIHGFTQSREIRPFRPEQPDIHGSRQSARIHLPHFRPTSAIHGLMPSPQSHPSPLPQQPSTEYSMPSPQANSHPIAPFPQPLGANRSMPSPQVHPLVMPPLPKPSGINDRGPSPFPPAPASPSTSSSQPTDTQRPTLVPPFRLPSSQPTDTQSPTLVPPFRLPLVTSSQPFPQQPQGNFRRHFVQTTQSPARPPTLPASSVTTGMPTWFPPSLPTHAPARAHPQATTLPTLEDTRLPATTESPVALPTISPLSRQTVAPPTVLPLARAFPTISPTLAPTTLSTMPPRVSSTARPTILDRIIHPTVRSTALPTALPTEIPELQPTVPPQTADGTLSMCMIERRDIFPKQRCHGAPLEINGRRWGALGSYYDDGEGCKQACLDVEICQFSVYNYDEGLCSAYASCNGTQWSNGITYGIYEKKSPCPSTTSTPAPTLSLQPTPATTLAPPSSTPSEGAVCQWPVGASGYTIEDFSLVTLEGASVGAHDVYKGVAIGGNLTDASPGESGGICSHNGWGHFLPSGRVCRSWVKETYQWKGHWKSEVKPTTGEFPFRDWARMEELAQRAKDLDSGEYRIRVIDQGGWYTPPWQNRWEDFCHKTYHVGDVRGADWPGDDNGKTLVVFNGSGTVCLRSNPVNGRKFGPSVWAPFARVVLMGSAGYVDGFVLARSFCTKGDSHGGPGSTQLHGDTYSGPLCEANAR